MPKPIDQRNVTLTENNRDVNYTHQIDVQFRNVSLADVPSDIWFTEATHQDDEDTTHHQVRVKSGSAVIAEIFWTRSAINEGALAEPTCEVSDEVRDPADSGETDGAVDGDDFWRPRLASTDNEWEFFIKTKHTSVTGTTVTRTRTSNDTSVTWAFVVKQGSTVIMRATLEGECESAADAPTLTKSKKKVGGKKSAGAKPKTGAKKKAAGKKPAKPKKPAARKK